jgi:hypothetical protein
MQTATFKNCSLTELNEAFGLKQIWQSDLLTQWQKCLMN